MEDQIVKKSKKSLLEQIHTERGQLEKTITRISPQGMLLPGACGEWSVKDVLAHISAWERRMIRWSQSHLKHEMPEVPLPWDVDRMNADSHARDKDKPLADVLEEFQCSFQDSLELVESLSQAQLETVYSDTWPMDALWKGIAANMSWHYHEHNELIRKWFKRRGMEA
jgi:hypothetical protein